MAGMATSRRDFLKFASLLSGAAGISGFVPDSIQRALAIEPIPGSTFADAEHIVILMQENRSFDHAFGTLQGVRGFNDPRALRLPNGNSVFVQTSAETGNSFAPWRLDLRDTRSTWMGSLPHSRNSQVDAWNHGHSDNWIDAKKSHANAEYAHMPLTMGHYTREDIPFYYALADAFTICDQSYCAAMTSTSPNRSMFFTGTIRDKQTTDSRVFMRNDEIFGEPLHWTTYPERLTQAGIPWRFYQNDLSAAGGWTKQEEAWLSNYGTNLLECFAAYNVQANANGTAFLQTKLDQAEKQQAHLESQLSEISQSDELTELQNQLSDQKRKVAKLKVAVADSGTARYKQLTPHERALHDAAFVTNINDPHYRSLEPLAFTADGEPQEIAVPKGDVLHQFRSDVESGKLPTVSWLAPSEHFSDHPSSPWYGAWWVSEIMDILTKNPEVWKKTIFILTYDENDGYFDHGISYVAADPKRPETGGASAGIDTGLEYTTIADELAQGVPEKDARTGPIGMGFRVPTIIASPWTRGGWVNSQLFDHTSTLQFLEAFLEKKYGKQVPETNISPWRRVLAGDLTSCFRPYNSAEPAFTYVDRDKHVSLIAQAKSKPLPTLPSPLTPTDVEAISANPTKAAAISSQEPGTRPSCALPYELHANAALSPDSKAIALELTAGNRLFGKRAAGAPFNVYLRNLKAAPGTQAATFAVKAGDTLKPQFPLALFASGHYEIEVHAPNGFYRSFTGSLSDAHPTVTTAVVKNNLEITVTNPTQTPQIITITDNSYGRAPITKHIKSEAPTAIPISLEASKNWYDFTLSTEGSRATMRLAGRIETGAPSITDPIMGAV
jgi:phospholipase C